MIFLRKPRGIVHTVRILASKASSDHFVRAFHDTYNMPTIVTNCSNNYGPYQFPENLYHYSSIIFAVVNHCPCMAKEKMFVIGCM